MQLTEGEAALLRELVRAGGHPRSVHELSRRLWSTDRAKAVNSLRVRTHGLHRKLEATG